MSWRIGTMYNTLKVPEDRQERFVEVCQENDHHVIFYRGSFYFDNDAMEYQDFLWEDWAKDLVDETEATGVVIWVDAEGDNKGTMWGYSIKKDLETGKTDIVKMTMLDCLAFLQSELRDA